MKTIHKLVLKSYLGPMFLTFFIVMFVLYVLAISIGMAVNASFWKQLKDNVE